MPPFIQQRDHILRDLALCQEHLEHLVAEYLLNGFGINCRRNGKHTVFVKTTVRNQDVQMRMKSKEVTECLYGHNRARGRHFVTHTGRVERFQRLPSTAAQVG